MSETQYTPGTPIPSLASLHAQLNRERPVFFGRNLVEPTYIRCMTFGSVEKCLEQGSLRHALPTMPEGGDA